MTQIERSPSAASLDSQEAAEWIRKNGLMLTAVLLICAQIWLKAGLLAHSYFRQDDYQLLDRAFGSGFTWRYLTTGTGVHLGPGALAVIWVVAKASRYSWTIVSAVNLLLLAGASVALLRLLRTLFGARPAILIPLAVYLFTPLTLPALSWWTASLGWLPLSLVTFLAVDAHVRYVRTGRLWFMVQAACWLAAGMLFAVQGALVPVLLLALTSAFLVPRSSWPAGVLLAVRNHWKAWVSYGVLLAGFTVFQLISPGLRPDKVPPIGQQLAFTGTLIRIGFVPGALGGPWRWWSIGDYAFAVNAPVLTDLSWVVAAIIVAASLWYRRRALRAWVILGAWLLIGDILPVVVGQSRLQSVSIIGTDLRYLADAVPVLAICLGLAFLPTPEEHDAYRARLPASRPRTVVAVLLAGAFLLGSLWSFHTYQAAASGESARSYIATARAASGRVRPGTVIVDTPVPAAVMAPVFFGRSSYTSSVVGPLIPRSAAVRWTPAPIGLIANLMMFDGRGRLWPAAVEGATSLPAPGKRGCWQVRGQVVQIPLNTKLYHWSWTAQLWNTGPAITLAVWFGGQWTNVTLPAGRHDVYVPAAGSGSSIFVQALTADTNACLSQVVVGTLQPSAFGQPVPAVPVP